MENGYDPGPNFDTGLYLRHNPDVAAAGIDPLEHYLQSGRAEGRAAYAAISNIVGGFDAQYYLQHNPDVAAAHVDPHVHYNTFGWHEGRNPNALFDTHGYLTAYGDVAAGECQPARTTIISMAGPRGAIPRPASTPPVISRPTRMSPLQHIDPLVHFLQHGMHEGRAAVNDGLWH